MTKSNSSARVGLAHKVRYNWGLLQMRRRGAKDQGMAAATEREVLKIADVFERATGSSSRSSSVLEIGFGARPMRAFALTALFSRVMAVDLDDPVLALRDLPRVFRRNGLERGIKSLVRHVAFDAREWRTFDSHFARYPGYSRSRADLVTADASSAALWSRVPDGSLDLIFSSDVFEHIPPAGLAVVLEQCRRALAPGGVCIIRPMVFTGISGGHDLEWYTGRVETNASDAAWGHLLDPDFSVNTYLNKLTRAEFRTMFEDAGFEVVTDEGVLGRLGERHLTGDRAAKLRSRYDDYELFSNRVEFLLRARV